MREQAEKLGVMGNIQSMLQANDDKVLTKKNSATHIKQVITEPSVSKPSEFEEIQEAMRKHKLALQQELEEKKRLETELSKLEERKNHFSRMSELAKKPNLAQNRIESEGKLKRQAQDLRDRNSLEKQSISKESSKKEDKEKSSLINKQGNQPKDSIKRQMSPSHEYSAQRKESKAVMKGNFFKEFKGIPEKIDFDSEYNMKRASLDRFTDDTKETYRSIDDAGFPKEKRLSGILSPKNQEFSNEKVPQIVDYTDMRGKVLQEKERKKREEQQRLENELKNIRAENLEARKIATEKKNALFRPSLLNPIQPYPEIKRYHDFKKGNQNNAQISELDNKREITEPDAMKKITSLPSFNQPLPQQPPLRHDENYGLYDDDFESDKEDNILKAVRKAERDGDEISELQQIEEEITSYQEKLNYKTTRIIELKKSLKYTKQYGFVINCLCYSTISFRKLEKTLLKNSQTEIQERIEIDNLENENSVSDEEIPNGEESKAGEDIRVYSDFESETDHGDT